MCSTDAMVEGQPWLSGGMLGPLDVVPTGKGFGPDAICVEWGLWRFNLGWRTAASDRDV